MPVYFIRAGETGPVKPRTVFGGHYRFSLRAVFDIACRSEPTVDVADAVALVRAGVCCGDRRYWIDGNDDPHVGIFYNDFAAHWLVKRAADRKRAVATAKHAEFEEIKTLIGRLEQGATTYEHHAVAERLGAGFFRIARRLDYSVGCTHAGLPRAADSGFGENRDRRGGHESQRVSRPHHRRADACGRVAHSVPAPQISSRAATVKLSPCPERGSRAVTAARSLPTW